MSDDHVCPELLFIFRRVIDLSQEFFVAGKSCSDCRSYVTDVGVVDLIIRHAGSVARLEVATRVRCG
jgi:hypothetical protein